MPLVDDVTVKINILQKNKFRILDLTKSTYKND